MISAILLAAGESKRMGKTKQLLPLGDSAILSKTLENLLKSGADEVIVVLGHMAEDVQKLLAGSPIKTVLNPEYRQGMSTSIISGLKAVSSETEAVMLVLADMPFIDSRTLCCLIEQFRRSEKGIAIPVYRGKRGHPVIFNIKYKKEMLGLSGDVGAREIIERHLDNVLEVAVECEGVIKDVDTEEDYRANLN